MELARRDYTGDEVNGIRSLFSVTSALPLRSFPPTSAEAEVGSWCISLLGRITVIFGSLSFSRSRTNACCTSGRVRTDRLHM